MGSIKRSVEPLSPQSSSVDSGKADGGITVYSVPHCSIVTPIAFRQPRVASMSSEVLFILITLLSFARAAQMSIRCATDLEAGASISPLRTEGLILMFRRNRIFRKEVFSVMDLYFNMFKIKYSKLDELLSDVKFIVDVFLSIFISKYNIYFKLITIW